MYGFVFEGVCSFGRHYWKLDSTEVYFLIVLCLDFHFLSIQNTSLWMFLSPSWIPGWKNNSHPRYIYCDISAQAEKDNKKATTSHHMTGRHLHSSPNWHKQLCQQQNYLKKKMCQQVWQATVNTNMMLYNCFYKHEFLATLQCTNSSLSFLLEKYKLLRAKESHIKASYKHPRNPPFSLACNYTQVRLQLRILFTPLKCWQSNQCHIICAREIWKLGVWL